MEPRSINIVVGRVQRSRGITVPLRRAPRALQLSGAFVRRYLGKNLQVINREHWTSVMAEGFVLEGPSCQTPGCVSPVFVDASGVASKYCKRTHRQRVFFPLHSVHKVTNPRAGGENAVASLVVLLRGTVHSSCASLVTTGR